MLALLSMLMSHTSLNFFVLSFVLACAYACVVNEPSLTVDSQFRTKHAKFKEGPGYEVCRFHGLEEQEPVSQTV